MLQLLALICTYQGHRRTTRDNQRQPMYAMHVHCIYISSDQISLKRFHQTITVTLNTFMANWLLKPKKGKRHHIVRSISLPMLSSGSIMCSCVGMIVAIVINIVIFVIVIIIVASIISSGSIMAGHGSGCQRGKFIWWPMVYLDGSFHYPLFFFYPFSPHSYFPSKEGLHTRGEVFKSWSCCLQIWPRFWSLWLS